MTSRIIAKPPSPPPQPRRIKTRLSESRSARAIPSAVESGTPPPRSPSNAHRCHTALRYLLVRPPKFFTSTRPCSFQRWSVLLATLYFEQNIRAVIHSGSGDAGFVTGVGSGFFCRNFAAIAAFSFDASSKRTASSSSISIPHPRSRDPPREARRSASQRSRAPSFPMPLPSALAALQPPAGLQEIPYASSVHDAFGP